MKFTYLMDPEQVQEQLARLWNSYKEIINHPEPTWEQVNEARSILYFTGQIYCEKIAVEAIERRLHLLQDQLSLVDFFTLIDQNSERLEQLRQDELFHKLERFYNIIKQYKNKYLCGQYYLEEEKFLEVYNRVKPDQNSKMGYKGSFNG